jgi:hypothetical protein
MENPSSWNLLTASLNIANVERDPDMAWSFLVVQGLVKSTAENNSSFLSLTQALSVERRKRGPMPGPSFGAQLAPRLSSLVLPPARQPDPMGKISRKRWEMTVSWRKVPGK